MIAVLYVDDEPSMLDIGKLFLEKTGQFSVETVTSAAEALERLKSQPCDVVVSDYLMPNMDGLEFLKILRKEYPVLPFIIFTGKGREEVAIAAFENGADFYIMKGADPQAQFVDLALKIKKSVEQRNAAQALYESESRFRQLIQNSSDSIWILDRDGHIVYNSPSTSRILGYPEDFFIGKKKSDFIHPEDRETARSAFESVVQKAPPGIPFEFRILAANGEYIYVESVAVNLMDVEGIGGMVITTRPITERKQAERELRSSEKKYRTLVERATDGIVVIDDGIIRFCNQRMAEIWGGAVAEITGRQFVDFTIPQEAARLTESYRKVISGECSGSAYDTRLYRKDGSLIDVGIRGSLVEFEGRPADLVIVRDITARKRMEVKLRQDAEKFRNIFETIPNLILSLDPSGKIVACNRRIRELFGKPEEAITGKTLTEAFPGLFSTEAIEACRNVAITGIPWKTELAFTNDDGTGKVLSLTVFRIQTDSIAVMFLDITAQKEAEKTSDLSWNQLRELFDAGITGIVIYDVQGEGNSAEDYRIRYINRIALEMAGWVKDVVEGKTIKDLLPDVECTRLIQIYERVWKTKEPGRYPTCPYNDGKSCRWFDIRVFRLSDDGIASVFTDITEQKQAELQLEQMNKKLTLISSITHHDMGNKLQILRGYIELIRQKTEDAAIVSMLKKMEDAGAAINEQIEFSRAYRRLGLAAPCWQETGHLIRKLVPGSISIIDHTGNLAIYADPMLEKVFSNLLDNTIRHGKHATQVTVTAKETEDRLILIWEDNGAGISLADKEKIFEKGFGKHTGFGLFLIREILAITDIIVRETGTPGSGARFEIEVPRGKYRYSGPQQPVI